MMRHLYATLYLKNALRKMKAAGVEIPDVYGFCEEMLRKKLRHISKKTTDTYIHLVLEKNSLSNFSPIDLLAEDLIS
jgi:integrase